MVRPIFLLVHLAISIQNVASVIMIVLASVFLRALLTGCVVVLALALAEASGPLWGAMIVTLPFIAGPTYAFMAMNHSGEYIAEAALSGFAANTATGVFLMVYAWLSPRASLVRALAPATLAWVISAALVFAVHWSPMTALALNAIVYGLGTAVFPMKPRAAAGRDAVTAHRLPDLSARALAITLFVFTVLVLSLTLSPEKTGILSAYPIAITCTLVILHKNNGGTASRHVAIAAMRGVFGFGLTLLSLHLLVSRLGVGQGLLTALLFSVGWSAMLVLSSRQHDHFLKHSD